MEKIKRKLEYHDNKLFYISIKVVAFILCFWGSLFLIDYYMASNIVSEEVLLADMIPIKENDRIVASETKVKTENFTFDVTASHVARLNKGDIITIEISQIFNRAKRITYTYQEEVFSFQPLNIFVLNGAFSKILLFSLFALLYRKIHPFAIAITAVNILVFLIIIKIPPLIVFLIFAGAAVMTFVVSLIMENKRLNRRREAQNAET